MALNVSSGTSSFTFSKKENKADVRKERFLRFVLLPDTNLILPLVQISAVLKIPFGQIVPIPEMPSWAMGVYNWRGKIVWMIDLGHLLGFTPWDQQLTTSSNHQVIIIHPSNQQKTAQVTGEMVGLIVSHVDDIDFCDPSDLHSPPASVVTPELAPFLRGYWVKNDGDIIVALDGDAILAGMPKTT